MMKTEKKQRTRCEVYTRVMWYHRPVSFFNEGKKSEFYSRKYYKIIHPNTKFNNLYFKKDTNE